MPQVDSLMPGDPVTLGAYRVTGRLGEGGQGVVFRGEGPAGEQVAIKLLHARLAADADARRRFVQEAAVAERVARFCTARVLHADVAGDRPYIVSEFVEGISLHELVTTRGPRTEGALDRIAIGTATALGAIHQAGLLHRDLKPHNVLMGPDGPRVIDFGIAKALDSMSAQTSQIVGTPSYMAPEQVRGDTLTPAVDVFAWACMIAFAGTGAAPYGNDAVPAVINRILNEDPQLTGLPPELETLLRTCLDKDPSHRPTARQVLARLLGHHDEPTHDHRPEAAHGRRDDATSADLLTQGTSLATALTPPPGGHTPAAAPAPIPAHGPAAHAPATAHGPATAQSPATTHGSAAHGSAAHVSATAHGLVGAYGSAAADSSTTAYQPAAHTRQVGRSPVRAVVWIVPAILVVIIAALGGALAMSVLGGDDSSDRPGPSGQTTGAPATGGQATGGQASAAGFPSGYAGTWTGTVRQTDGRSWPIQLTMAAGASVGQVAYDSPGCSGTQTLISRSGDTLSLREDITVGKAVCTDQGSVTLRLQQDGTIAFTYSARRDTGTGTYSATAVLQRT